MTNTEAIKEVKFKLPGTIAYLSMYPITFAGLVCGQLYAPEPFSRAIIWGLILGYFPRMLLVTAIGHRYMSHKTFEFKSNKVRIIFMALFTTCLQKGALWWAWIHRLHHMLSDKPGDPHKSNEPFIWSQWCWFLSGRYEKTDFSKIPDLVAIRGAMTVEKYYLVGPIALGAVYFVCGRFSHAGGFPNPLHSALYMLSVGFFGSTVLLSNGTSFINSLAHKWGSVKYKTGDHSRNSILLALITLGEGLHNNHHKFPGKVWSGEGWQRIIDFTGQFIWLMKRLGLVVK